VPVYRLYDTAGGNLGQFEDPATTIAPGDIVVLEDGRDARVTTRIETSDERRGATLVVFTAPGLPRIPTWRGVEFPAPRRFDRVRRGSKVR
jgi:Lhr-like helicase